MEDFANLLHRDYGIKPQGKMAPMSAAKATASAGGEPAIKGKSSSGGSNARSARASFGDDDLFFGSKPRNASSSSEPLGGSYDDVFGGPPKFAPPKHTSSSAPSVPVYEDIFRSQPPPPPSSSSSRDHSLPVFDAPYEDDIFVGVRGTRSSSGVSYDNVFGGGGGGASSSESPTDDLLGGYRSGPKTKPPPPQFDTGSTPYDDDLIPGMGSGYSSSKQPEPSSFISVDEPAPASTEVDPFAGIEPDPFSGVPSVSDPLDPFTGYPKSVRQSFGSSRKADVDNDSDDSLPEGKEEAVQEEYVPAKDYVPNEEYIPADSYGSGDFTEEGTSREFKEPWVTVHSVRLLTDPTVAPPPSRPPPGLGYHESPYVNGRHDFQGGLSDDEDEAEARYKLEKERELQRKAEREEEERIQREREEKERLRREREAVERATQEARQRAAKQARERVERIAVEKATAEARERAAADARQRAAERAAAEKAASEKAAAETRARERAAVDRINAQVRERAAEEARIAAEKKAGERAAVGKINAQVRERAAEEARKAAAAQNKAKEQRSSSDDFEGGIFGRATSAPKQRPPTSDFSKPFPSSDKRGSSGAPVKKVSSVSGIDELTNLFDNPSSPFREIDGETPDRRKARLERDQRTQARARQALDEKHRRDLATQREQAEKHRASETLDSEIKRWAAGKEGNLRALLSTLQYVLWPECGWQPVSLTDLLTGAAVKKVYRRATLCVHPDKVQQKGATIQQKYIAEKVFDLLKEAWNKFNSEELF
ncbi:hypothetical protein SELMODRAFT_451301 [Selaginella moellendorffii]|uniref:Uncharacterized protein JAC1L1-1 n=1 Tax=Selaginella moellendorffii TaxID=88036 RepID=D8R9F2_SELML|nr:auxilin-related protein 1 [Selaginella moellendorffii]EFJ31400.1 hypothetical protein SELMODRAFT_451301 [Selaginella moellendorffii]|eukprot:XP_002968053.1 auxilin-related protein 1 [Selaginella moellendorffii]